MIGEDDLARVIVDAVDQLDLSAIEASYNQDGDGRSAIDPAAMLATLVYAYAHKVLSSRQIEIACRYQVVYRWLSGQAQPDHATIARFRQRHSKAFQDLFAQVLDLVRRYGLGEAGTIALDGTKLKGNAALEANKTLKAITRELTESAQIRDLAENAKFGKKRGDELPKHLRGAENRRRRLEEAKRQIEAEQHGEAAAQQEKIEKREAEERATGRKKRGRKPKPPEPEPDAKANTTDPDSRPLKTRQGFVQGFNAQAVVSLDQIILAADVVQDANDVKQLLPMVKQAQANVARIAAEGVAPEITAVLADAGYASEANLEGLEGLGVEGFIPSSKSWKLRKELKAKGRPRGRMKKGMTRTQRMERKLRTVRGEKAYKARGQTIEPVFGQTKHGFQTLTRRGLAAAKADWNLLCLAHNVKKLWRARKAA
ncbi:MAG TPA: transposase [Holophaga sp.]|nr:transposase [Holophaga sp.]